MTQSKTSAYAEVFCTIGYKNNPQFYWGQKNERSEQ